MAIQQQQPQQQQWAPRLTEQQTRSLVNNYRKSPGRYNVEDIRNHAQHYNVPFYEGEFGILDAVKQAAGGLWEGFTTLRISDPPDNEYEAIARNIGHLAGFVPGLLSAPLKALGLVKMARGASALKSIPILGADAVTEAAKKIVKPALKASRGSRFDAVDTASKFMLADKAKHITEGAFHLGVASSISSVWDGVDTMMESFVGGAMAGGVFRGIGNIIPGTTKGDKALRALSGSMFMGLPQTFRGATTPEQIYEYLAGAYFGGKEMPWYRAKANKVLQKMEKQAQTDVLLEIERQPEKIKGWEELPEIVQKEVSSKMEERYGNLPYRSAEQYILMKQLGVLDQIPEAVEAPEKGYELLFSIKKGQQKKTRKQAHGDINIATSGGAQGADTAWGKTMNKFGVPVVHYLSKGRVKDFETRKVQGIRRDLSETELYSLGHIVDKANTTLERKLDPKFYDIILRNAHQIKNANSVFAIGEIETSQTGKRAHLNGRTVKGGSGWAVQMGIDKGLQKIFVYDQKQKSWFKFDAAADRFKPILEAPKLTRNPALIGTRKMTKEGYRAIEDVAQVTFGDQPIVKSQVKGAVPQEKVQELHPKTTANLKVIQGEIDITKQGISDLQSDIKSGNLGKVALKTAKSDLKLQKQILRDYESIEKSHLKLAPTEYKDTVTGKVVNDSDVGMRASEFSLMKKGEYFATQHLKPVWEGSYDKRSSILNAGVTVEKAVRNHMEVGNKNVKYEEAIKEIEDTFRADPANEKFKLNEDAKLNVKRWMTELNMGKQVTFIRTFNGDNLTYTKPERPVSLAGKPLSQLEPQKLVEEVYYADGGKGKTGQGNPLIIFDSVALRNKRGMLNDVPIDKLADFYQFQEGMKKDNAVKKANDVKTKVINRMFTENNMYPLGGQGDKGRVNFVKLHPTTTSLSKTKTKTEYAKLKRVLNTFDKATSKLLKEDMRLAKKEMGISNEAFMKMLHSNVMYDLSLNGLKNTPENIKKIMGPGFIGNAIAYNKRAQIWMTNGYGGNKDFIRKQLNDLSSEGNYKYILVDDPKKAKKSSLKASNIELPEHVDGAIIVRDDVIDAVNLDAGHPKSGQNKSFIIDPSTEHGALLGKYMMHAAGKSATAEMQKKGLHMMIMTSAAKQTGTRIVGDYNVKNGKLDIGKTPLYELNPESVKYNSSVINDHHMAQKQIWVKQLFTNLHRYGYKEIPKEIIEDIHNEVIQKAYDGQGVFNKELQSYIKTLNPEKVDYLIENMENIGTNELISALRTPGAERFAEKAMQKMLRVVEEGIEADYRSGEISAQERHKAIKEMQSDIGPIDKLLKNVAIVGEEAALEGKTGYSGYLHKFIAPYRQAVLHNYFVKNITRPKVDNSAVARIRPYDKFMQEKFPKLNKDDTIFYLDNAYRETKIKLPNKTTTLGQLWDAYNSGKISSANKKLAEDVFEAVVLRVPMDSMSGAHKLNFKGFTGRKGHGILMHSRTMRALGGADLDGDEAFMYFGGKRADGTGYGMKKSWKDAIHAQKEEFYSKGDVKDNKADFREELTEGADPNTPIKRSKALYFSPYSRLKASEGATSGRNMLGVAVSQGQVMKSMYNSLMEATGRQEKISITTGKGKKKKELTIIRTPKTSKKDRTLQREMTRAQIAFASDPLDEAGLKGMDVFFKKLHDAYFNVKVVDAKGKEVKVDLKPWQLKKGLFDTYRKMNQAYFGRNYAENRRFTMDEVNDRAGRISDLSVSQQNTILPKMVNTLQGTDWSDNLFHRVRKPENLKQLYTDINTIAKNEFKWMKPLMQRSSFEVPYNTHVRTVIENKIYDRYKRRELAKDIPTFIKAVKGTTWGNHLRLASERKAHLYNYKKRLKILEEIAELGEHYLSNDLADMATLLNLKRIKDNYKLNGKRISAIHHTVEKLKARSYLNIRERKELDYSAFVGDKETRQNSEMWDFINKLQGLKIKKSDLAGDKRSATWDQAMIDEKITAYKKTLKNAGEVELFDHLMIGTYRRGDLSKIEDIVKQVPWNKYNPAMNDVLKQHIYNASDTRLSRLGFNSNAISDKAIRDHLRAMNDAFGKAWKEPSKEEIEKSTESLNKQAEESNIAEKSEVDALVEGALRNEGYAGIKKGEVSKADKELMVRLATNLKKHNNKIGNNLNEVLRGIMDQATGRGKDLNAMNKQDFEIVNNYLEEIEGGTVFQKIWGKKKGPEMQKRYWTIFPAAVNRELMSYDIKWLKKEGYYVNKDGDVKKGFIRRPTYFLEVMQNWIHKSNELGTGRAQELATKTENEFLNLRELKDGNFLFQVGVYERELGIKDIIANSNEPASYKKSQKLNYDISLKEIEKEFGVKWKDIQNKEYTLTNDKGNRIKATGLEVVRGNPEKDLSGIKQKQTTLFSDYHKIITGDEKAFNKYTTGKFYDKNRTQPIMNWRKFVTDMGRALERGDDIPMNIGIDGMRHISRSLMVDLHGEAFKDIQISKTQSLAEKYWPHMFFNRTSAEKSMKEAIERVKKDPTMTEEEKGAALRNILLRHKTLSGDWEFQDMQDWDRVDQLNYKQGLKDLAQIKKERKQKIHWADADIKFGAMFSRKGHIGGWSKDMSVMNAYTKNLANTYYRQISQIMTNKVIDDAWRRMSHKFGPELASKWSKYFKLYAQGAMGNPDVIPEKIYNDPDMKLKGTPYGWWADSTVLKRVNQMREKLGIRESDLPKELREFTYQDIKNWSNMEAKFELMSLLAHPKSSVTNIFGGTIHTIQSAGIGAIRKARDIKFLKRINPNWNSINDVTDWVIKKGVVPEFLVHELGLGKETGQENVSRFVNEFASKLNSNDPIERKEIFSLGKKHGLSDKLINTAAKFMSVPERMLRRDAFMAHYIRAWERFGGAIRDPEHPFLIEMGKKGVKATQFLYEAPFRPFFARTALGKVMSRFQLFAWNSARFRNDIIRQAKIYGFKPGSEAFERYKRTATIDLFTVALANMFAFSLFDNALPSPWNWFQDTSEWLFGDEKERNKAFFGMYPGKFAPLQLVTPPLARFPVSSLRQWIDDDYGKFSDYYVWTMFPFGRLARDVFQPEQGLIDNPMRIMEKFTGMPVMDLARQKAKKKKAIEEGTRYEQPKVGF